MQFVRNSLFTRSTTMFGVCEALGQDFGVSPTWFRVAFAFAVIYNIEAAVLAYVAAGALVLISRLLHPNPVIAAEAEPVATDAVATEKPAETVLAHAA